MRENLFASVVYSQVKIICNHRGICLRAANMEAAFMQLSLVVMKQKACWKCLKEFIFSPNILPLRHPLVCMSGNISLFMFFSIKSWVELCEFFPFSFAIDLISANGFLKRGIWNETLSPLLTDQSDWIKYLSVWSLSIRQSQMICFYSSVNLPPVYFWKLLL